MQPANGHAAASTDRVRSQTGQAAARADRACSQTGQAAARADTARAQALLNIISNPVNSTVPIAASVLKAAGVYDPKRLFGVTTLDVVRSAWESASACQGAVPQEHPTQPVWSRN